MATRDLSPPNSTSSPEGEKGFNEKSYGADTTGHVRGMAFDEETALHRGLKARHITMIAIGGAIGTGLIIGTGSALANSGPGSLFIGYLLLGFVVFLVMAALGEMAAWFPMSAGFTGYASRFCDPSLGFALGWTYWLKYIIVTPNQLTAGALVMQYWVKRERVNPGVWITIFLVLIICINFFGIKFFGEFEFWLSSFKVITIVGVILLTLVLALGGGPDGDRKGFRYWRNPGAFKEQHATGALGRFLGFWSIMVNATFAYLGTELVGVTVAEAQNPRRTVPRAIKLTFYRILFFYVLSVFLVGMVVPHNSRELAFATSATSSANASPFVVAIRLAGIGGLDHVLNACILLFVFSASNSDLYIASRTLYGLACDENAPRIFTKTNKLGVPYYSTGVASVVALIAYMNVSNDSRQVFLYFVNVVTVLGLMTWISILVTHIFFVRARNAQGLENKDMPYVAPLGIWGSYGALFICILVALTKNYSAFIAKPAYGKFDYKTFVTGYIGIPVYLGLIFGHKWFTKSKTITPLECDLYTGKDIIDREEEEFLAAKALKEANENPRGMRWFYKTFIAWLF
ncbi:Proline-specific permease [Sphaceloma murrayae]|uniref:Proline-specific permease n=1 Tax=Sphaceloma murrayae TaxID=2082308 RepID=A0A2K1QIC0_9PEZI|nr:Proline-specific permease [Sphaceloma murrayae]